MSESVDIAEIDPWWFSARPDLDSRHTAGLLDADTLDLEFDQGFQNSHRTRGRVVEIDSAETWFTRHDTEEYRTGMAQKQFAFEWLAQAAADHRGAWPLLVRTGDLRGTRDRWLVDVYRKSDGQRYVDAFLERWPAFTWPRPDPAAALEAAPRLAAGDGGENG